MLKWVKVLQVKETRSTTALNMQICCMKPTLKMSSTLSPTNLLPLQQLTDFFGFLRTCDDSVGRNFGQVAVPVSHDVLPSAVSAQQLKLLHLQTFGPVFFIFAFEMSQFGDSETSFSRRPPASQHLSKVPACSHTCRLGWYKGGHK